MKIFKLFGLTLFLGLMVSSVTAQSEAELYKLGMKYKKDVDNKKMFQVFKKLVGMDSTNADYQAHLSFAYSKVGANLEDKKLKKKYYAKAKSVAKTAKQLDSKLAMAYYSYALALARENENASSKEKIANAKEIKSNCDKALAIDPKLAGAYHIMGRWHRTFAGFSNFEKTMVNTFFGGTPKGGTYKDALKMFQKAIEVEPWYMLHVYELAMTYYEMGDKETAKKYVEKAMKLPQNYEDAKKCYKMCEELKAKL